MSAGAKALPPSDGLETPRRIWSAVAIGLAIGMAVLDGTIANVAWPCPSTSSTNWA